MKENKNEQVKANETKIFTRIKKYFSDRHSLTLQMEDITHQLENNSQEISIVLSDLDGLKEKR